MKETDKKKGVGSEQSHIRFDTLCAYTGPADEIDVRDMLESVAQKNYPQTEGSYGLLQEKGSFSKRQ